MSKLEEHTYTWVDFMDLVGNPAKLTVGHPNRQRQDWFDENDKQITNLLKEKQEAFTSLLNDQQSTSKNDRLKHLRGKVQHKLCKMKDNWWEAKTEELQRHADKNLTNKLSDGLKTVYGP
jgi:hypothetical protein